LLRLLLLLLSLLPRLVLSPLLLLFLRLSWSLMLVPLMQFEKARLEGSTAPRTRRKRRWSKTRM
jgi:hypothetical protein